MITLLKLGGSLITDKRKQSTFRPFMMKQIAQEISTFYHSASETKLIIGHGSGSFGHFVAKEHATIDGVNSKAQWKGFAEVATIAAHLNFLVAEALAQLDLPIMRVQPSASAICHDGQIREMALSPIKHLLTKGVIPLVYGDVAIDDVRGGTIISTESIFMYLTQHLDISKIILVGEVEGVYDNNEQLISKITPENFDQTLSVLKGSAGTDVTGGMLTKVQDMVALVKQKPTLKIHIINGTHKSNVFSALEGNDTVGTLIINN